jgi:hypothetical protein
MLGRRHPRRRGLKRWKDHRHAGGVVDLVDPRLIPEVAAGYFWDPTQVTGSGATLVIPEGNGKTAYNMVTPSASAAPTAGVLNGQAVLQYVNGTPDQLIRTNATVQRGWTGATYLAVWLQAAIGPGSILGHYRTAQNLQLQVASAVTRVGADTGTGFQQQRFDGLNYATPLFIEAIFDPSQAATGRLRLFVDRVEKTATLTVSPGTSLVDTAEFITAGGINGDNLSTNYNNDFKAGAIYLANGIPSDADRDLLFSHRRLK